MALHFIVWFFLKELKIYFPHSFKFSNERHNTKQFPMLYEVPYHSMLFTIPKIIIVKL